MFQTCQPYLLLLFLSLVSCINALINGDPGTRLGKEKPLGMSTPRSRNRRSSETGELDGRVPIGCSGIPEESKWVDSCFAGRVLLTLEKTSATSSHAACLHSHHHRRCRNDANRERYMIVRFVFLFQLSLLPISLLCLCSLSNINKTPHIRLCRVPVFRYLRSETRSP